MRTNARLMLAGILLAATGCDASPGGFSPEDAATAVAATVAAMASPTETAPPLPTAEEHALPTAVPTAAAPELIVAYTDGGNVALLAGAGPAVPLTSSGSVEQLRLSDDGQKVAYTRRPVVDQPVELRVVNRDGTGDTLLMGPADFDALYPLGGAIHHDVYQFDFLPGSHVLLFNTRSIFEGPGLAKHDDLIRIDTDSLARTMLLAPGKGGDFTASPDGRFLALVRPGSAGTVVVPGTIEIANVDGTPTGSDVINYAPVITYSEYAYYAQPVWKPDSSMIGVAIPSPDPLAPVTSGEIWTMAVAAPPSMLGSISGQLFLIGGGNAPLLSPTLAQVAFTRPTATPNVWSLHVASASGAAEVLAATGGISWEGWSPDGAHFVFGLDGPLSLQLGEVSGTVSPLVSGTDLKWFNPSEFLFLSGSMGAWTLQRGGIGLPSSLLASPSGDFVQFDLAHP